MMERKESAAVIEGTKARGCRCIQVVVRLAWQTRNWHERTSREEWPAASNVKLNHFKFSAIMDIASFSFCKLCKCMFC